MSKNLLNLTWEKIFRMINENGGLQNVVIRNLNGTLTAKNVEGGIQFMHPGFKYGTAEMTVPTSDLSRTPLDFNISEIYIP